MLSLLFYPLVNLSQPLLSLFSRERSSSISLSIDSPLLLVSPPLPCEWFKGGGRTLLSLTSLLILPPPSPSLSPFSFFFPFLPIFQSYNYLAPSVSTHCHHRPPHPPPTTHASYMSRHNWISCATNSNDRFFCLLPPLLFLLYFSFPFFPFFNVRSTTFHPPPPSVPSLYPTTHCTCILRDFRSVTDLAGYLGRVISLVRLVGFL
jgi:hypothetical protein